MWARYRRPEVWCAAQRVCGAGYIDRHWPPAFKNSGAWPLTSLRQSFLNGALTRLIDPDAVLRQRIIEFVGAGYFGFASGEKGGGEYERLWFREPVGADEVAFESGVFLLTRAKAEQLRKAQEGQNSDWNGVHTYIRSRFRDWNEARESPNRSSCTACHRPKSNAKAQGYCTPRGLEPAGHENPAQTSFRG